MDATAKDQFRWKFYHLAIHLNIIVILVVVPVIFLFLFPKKFEVYRFPLIAGMLLAALLLSLSFRKNYRETRAWLQAQPDKKEE
ncbi:MAG: hypothetical protein LUP97_07110 [Methanoregula sp.]|nr:hypothetical protein [Methanoregula sp.]WML67008.1 MAG: hypothetical protein METHP_00482 [Methanoregula sp. SKADARSKE-2]